MAGPPPTKILKVDEDFVTKKLKLDENLAKVEKNIENNEKELRMQQLILNKPKIVS